MAFARLSAFSGLARSTARRSFATYKTSTGLVGLAVDPNGRQNLLDISNEILENIKVRDRDCRLCNYSTKFRISIFVHGVECFSVQCVSTHHNCLYRIILKWMYLFRQKFPDESVYKTHVTKWYTYFAKTCMENEDVSFDVFHSSIHKNHRCI